MLRLVSVIWEPHSCVAVQRSEPQAACGASLISRHCGWMSACVRGKLQDADRAVHAAPEAHDMGSPLLLKPTKNKAIAGSTVCDAAFRPSPKHLPLT